MDEIKSELAKIGVRLDHYNRLLDDHMKRTELLEDQLSRHEKLYSFFEIGFKIIVGLGILIAAGHNLGWW